MADAPDAPDPAGARIPVPVCLTVAGSDSSGGAGVQADLKTFAALGVFGTSALTALTAQNTTGVFAVATVDPDFLRAQIRAVFEDLPVAAAKTGMLADAPRVEAVAAEFAHWIQARAPRPFPLVVDPVAVARGGDPLIDPAALGALRAALFPLATVLTPNRRELEMLTGLPVRAEDDLRRAARALFEAHRRPVLAKGGAVFPGALDVLVTEDALLELRRPDAPIPTRSTHGTGCALSAALAAELARGADLPAAARRAKAFVTRAIAAAPGLGRGHGPIGFHRAAEVRTDTEADPAADDR